MEFTTKLSGRTQPSLPQPSSPKLFGFLEFPSIGLSVICPVEVGWLTNGVDSLEKTCIHQIQPTHSIK